MSDRNRGGRMPAEERNRPVAAKGVGENSKRHDLERRSVPFLHGSDLQKGDVEAMRQGQRIAPKQTQQPAVAPRTGARGGGSTTSSSPGATVPDPIEFLGERQGKGLNVPQRQRRPDNERALSWLPIVRELAKGPGSSGLLARTLINQARALQSRGALPATNIDLQAVDDGIEAMLDAGVRNQEPE